VESVLDGSIQKVGDRLRLTVQLVRVSDGRHLWADKFDEKFTDILNVEDRISERVASALALHMPGGEKNLLAKHYTDNPEAYQLYLRGRYFWNKRTEEDLKKSKEYFEQAIVKDPNCALAYGGLSDYYILIAGTEGPKEAIPKAREAAAKALALDETLAEPHTVLGFIKWAYDADWGEAEREFKRAIELNPNDELAHDRYSVLLSQMGRSEEAFAEIKIAQELDPFSLLVNMRIAIFLYRTRQYDPALEQCRKTLELDGNYPRVHWVLALIYDQKGMNNEAIAEIQRVITVSGRTDDNLAQLGRAYALAGNRREATKVLNEMKELSKERYVHPASIAIVHASLGEKDQAFEWLDKSLEQRDSQNGLKVDPQWDSLRSDPRFADLLRRVRLAP
jgi:tetratricopeptide (TPR) repeat protein